MIKTTEFITCDKEGCNRRSPADELPVGEPFYHIRATIEVIDLNGTTTIMEVDTHRCPWHYHDLLLDEMYGVLRDNLQARRALPADTSGGLDSVI